MSFVLIAVVGINQFFAPLLFKKSFLIQQWWIKDLLPRVSAFSYEPSYLATYLLLGWILLFEIYRKKISLFGRKTDLFLLTLISVCIGLTTSRIVILVLFTILLLFIIFQIFKTQIAYFSVLLLLSLAVLVMITGYLFTRFGESTDLLLSGTGILEDSNYSLFERINNIDIMLKALVRNKILGCGIGGIPETIAIFKNEHPSSITELKIFEGNCVILELLLAGGLLSTIPIFLFCRDLIQSLKNNQILQNSKLKKLSKSYLNSLIVFFLVLQYNQNILRSYFWIHLGLFIGITSCINRISINDCKK